MSWDEVDILLEEMDKFARKEIRECPCCGRMRPLTNAERQKRHREKLKERSE